MTLLLSVYVRLCACPSPSPNNTPTPIHTWRLIETTERSSVVTQKYRVKNINKLARVLKEYYICWDGSVVAFAFWVKGFVTKMEECMGTCDCIITKVDATWLLCNPLHFLSSPLNKSLPS